MRAEHRAIREEFRRMRHVHRARRRYDDYRWWRGEDDVTALEELRARPRGGGRGRRRAHQAGQGEAGAVTPAPLARGATMP